MVEAGGYRRRGAVAGRCGQRGMAVGAQCHRAGGAGLQQAAVVPPLLALLGEGPGGGEVQIEALGVAREGLMHEGAAVSGAMQRSDAALAFDSVCPTLII